MQTKLIVFDLDGTLAKIGGPILEDDVRRLKELEMKGIRIAICSGKPTYYLCGMFRQVGLKAPILLGENGGVVQFGIDLPPREFYILPYTEEAKQTLAMMRHDWTTLFPDMWYQPNLIGITPFPKEQMEFDEINAYLSEQEGKLRGIEVYRFVDSFDIVPTGISKKAGVAYLAKLLNVQPDEVIAVGDGENDYPMFDYAGRALGICVKDSTKVDVNFEGLSEALDWLENGC